jgi:ABC-type antimicrobial peptide transport system permease subunit
MPLVYTQDDWQNELSKNKTEFVIAILTIPVYISEISQILQAINLLSLFLYAMMLLIILVSAGVTYRLILHERRLEIATMRAIGADERAVRFILVLEAVFLASAALIFGFILALFVNWCMSFVSFDWMPSFEMFLIHGRLHAVHKISALLINIAAVYIVIILAVYFPVFRASRLPLPQMLSGGVKG